mmetsp:Transcript_65527/g.189925  ORF Transcript_65527/g.189925 Transcript_65527/m.189925 type:complete len:416 (+) Transcript_65527:116-1363(+)
MARPSLAVVALATMLVDPAACIDNGLGLTPPLGWRSWNLFAADVNQTLLESIMDGLVARKRMVDGVPTSLCDLGYCEVGLDDAWQACGDHDGYNYHDALGRPVVNTTRFPDMAAMTAKAHSLGLTAGWYHNNCICRELKEPTHAMYVQDVHYLADVFHFDAVKLDGCGKQYDLDLWASIINKTGRPIMIENCHWGQTVPTETWCPWNYFRTSEDIVASYDSIVKNLQTTIQWAQKGLSRPGCWGYPDMLEVGVKGLSLTEARSHFGAWCIVSSPLILSHDVNDDGISVDIWPVISNKEALAVNQAWAGHSGSPFKHSSVTAAMPTAPDVPEWQYFYKPLGGGKVAVLMMNHGPSEQRLTLNLRDVPGLACDTCHVRDIWSRQDLPAAEGTVETTLPSHDSAFLVLSAVEAPPVQI